MWADIYIYVGCLREVAFSHSACRQPRPDTVLVCNAKEGMGWLLSFPRKRIYEHQWISTLPTAKLFWPESNLCDAPDVTSDRMGSWKNNLRLYPSPSLWTFYRVRHGSYFQAKLFFCSTRVSVTPPGFNSKELLAYCRCEVRIDQSPQNLGEHQLWCLPKHGSIQSKLIKFLCQINLT